MKAIHIPTPFGWSEKRTSALSLALAIGGFGFVRLARIGGLLPPADLGTFADFYSIIFALIGLVAPTILAVIWHLIHSLRPGPGDGSFGPTEREKFRLAQDHIRRCSTCGGLQHI
jgi:hypothetical protein